jgi:hypothetical protein
MQNYPFYESDTAKITDYVSNKVASFAFGEPALFSLKRRLGFLLFRVKRELSKRKGLPFDNPCV